MKNISTLVEDIHTLAKDGKKIEVQDIQTCKDFGTSMFNLMKQFLDENNKGKREFRLRGSNFGKPCTRQLWYDNHGGKTEEFEAPQLIKFFFGHMLEEVLLTFSKAAGHTVTGEQEEHSREGVLGHQDARIDGELVDVKSASTYSYNKFKSGELNSSTDGFGYLPQLSFYRKDPTEPAHFLVIDKTLGNICLHTPKSGDMVKDVDEKIRNVKDEINMDEPPKRAFEDLPDGKSGNRKLAPTCSYCPHKHECWEGLRTFLYSDKPRFLTVVEREPKVMEITNND